MAGPDEVFQLVALPVVLGAGGVAGVGGEEADSVVAPVVVELLAPHLPVVLHLVELKDGHELNGVDPQALQIGQLLHEAGEGAGVGHARGVVPGEAPDVELVDEQILRGDQGLAGVPPVEVVLDYAGLVVLAPGGGVAPAALAGDGPGVGVQKVLVAVEDLPLLRLVGTVHPVGVLKGLNVQLEDDHGVDVADAVVLGEGQHGVGLLGVPLKQQQLDGGGPVGVDGEVHPAGDGGGAVDLVEPRPHVEAVDGVQGHHVDGARQAQLLHRTVGQSLFFHLLLLASPPRSAGTEVFFPLYAISAGMSIGFLRRGGRRQGIALNMHMPYGHNGEIRRHVDHP